MSLATLYHFYPLHSYLDVSWAIAAESLSLYLGETFINHNYEIWFYFSIWLTMIFHFGAIGVNAVYRINPIFDVSVDSPPQLNQFFKLS